VQQVKYNKTMERKNLLELALAEVEAELETEAEAEAEVEAEVEVFDSAHLIMTLSVIEERHIMMTSCAACVCVYVSSTVIKKSASAQKEWAPAQLRRHRWTLGHDTAPAGKTCKPTCVRETRTYRMRSRFSLSRQHTSRERGPRDTLC
jgi:hypothetical protein